MHKRLSPEDTSSHTGNGDKEVVVVSQWMCYLTAFGHESYEYIYYIGCLCDEQLVITIRDPQRNVDLKEKPYILSAWILDRTFLLLCYVML